jgi:hypothetical protein
MSKLFLEWLAISAADDWALAGSASLEKHGF